MWSHYLWCGVVWCASCLVLYAHCMSHVSYPQIPSVGLLQLPKMPDTMMFGNGSQFGAEGLRITPVKPMAAWKIQYEGPMKYVACSGTLNRILSFTHIALQLINNVYL